MKESDVPRGNDYAPRTFRSYHHRVSEGPIPPIWPQNRASGLPKLNAHSTFANPWTSGQSHESHSNAPNAFHSVFNPESYRRQTHRPSQLPALAPPEMEPAS